MQGGKQGVKGRTFMVLIGKKCLEESRSRPLWANLGESQMAVAFTVYIMLWRFLCFL